MRKKIDLSTIFMYLGSILGVGFASGQEIDVFFARYGLSFVVGALVFVTIFVYVNMKVQNVAQMYHVDNLCDFNNVVFGKYDSYINVILIVNFTITASAMLAGCENIFSMIYDFKFPVMALFCSILCFFMLIGKFDSIKKISAIVIPLLLSLFVVVLISFFTKGKFEGSLDFSVGKIPHSILLATLFTLSNSLGALNITIKDSITDNRTRSLIIVGAIIMSMICLTSFVLLLSGNNGISMPLLTVAKSTNIVLYILYAIIMYFALMTTYLILVYNIRGLIKTQNDDDLIKNAIIILAVFILSNFGFDFIVKYFYIFSSALAFIYYFFILIKDTKINKN